MFIFPAAQGFGDNDVYVCEFRYTARTRSFKKIKVHLQSARLQINGKKHQPSFLVLSFKSGCINWMIWL